MADVKVVTDGAEVQAFFERIAGVPVGAFSPVIEHRLDLGVTGEIIGVKPRAACETHDPQLAMIARRATDNDLAHACAMFVLYLRRWQAARRR